MHQKMSKYSAYYMFFTACICLNLASSFFNEVYRAGLMFALQFVTMPRVSGLQRAGDHYIQVSAVSSGYHQCGHVEWHNDQISHLRDTAGNQKIVICKSLTGLSSWQSRYSYFFFFDLVVSNTSQQDYYLAAIFIKKISWYCAVKFSVLMLLIFGNNTVPTCFGTFISCK